MIEMHRAGVSVRRIEDVSEVLRESNESAANVSNLNDRMFEAVEGWMEEQAFGLQLPLCRVVDGIYLKRS